MRRPGAGARAAACGRRSGLGRHGSSVHVVERQPFDQGVVHGLDGLAGLRAAGDIRLVRDHDQKQAERRQAVDRLSDAGQDLDLARVVRAGGARRRGRRSGSARRPGRGRPLAGVDVTRIDSHLVPTAFRAGVRDQQVPDHRLERLGVGGDVVGIDRRHDDAGVGHLGRVAAVPADDAADRGSDRPGVLQGRDQVRADVRSRSPPPTESTRTRSLSLRRLPRSHSTKTVSQPSSLVRAVSSETLSVGA